MSLNIIKLMFESKNIRAYKEWRGPEHYLGYYIAGEAHHMAGKNARHGFLDRKVKGVNSPTNCPIIQKLFFVNLFIKNQILDNYASKILYLRKN